ncbi:MAG: hypothetical protein H6733_04160 [Alphaproteobacteria bacterium]|nr:hypothetical protein [Alphaproteobacteria bacterium]
MSFILHSGRALPACGVLLALAACTGSPDPAGDTDSDDPTVDACAALGLASKPFDATASELTYNAVVPDLELPTLDGTFRLSATWTGCDAYALVPVDGDFLAEDLAPLLTDADPNSVFVFLSGEDRDAAAADAVKAVRADLRDVLRDLDDADAEHWRARLHYVSVGRDNADVAAIVDGLQGSDLAGIDLYQRLRRGGSLAVSSSAGWLRALSHARYTPKGYAYEARLGERLADEAATEGDRLRVITLLDADWDAESHAVGDVTGVITLDLPPADALARYDRAELVMREMCGDSPFFHEAEGCTGEQGRTVAVCDGDCGTDDDEHVFFKIVSGYNTGGWWTQDVTQALPAIRRGGRQSFRITGPGIDDARWHAHVELRLHDDVDDTDLSSTPTAAVRLPGWTGIGLQAAYSELTAVYEVTPPAGTTRVVFRDVASTHGGGGNGGCAEFCTTEQTLTVDGIPFDHAWEQKDVWDCAARVDQGVTPNQWGTWYFDRASWCPGWTAEVWEADVTDAFDLTGPNTLTLSATQGHAYPYTGTLAANPWLVFYGGQGEPIVQAVPRATCSNVHVRLRDFADTFPDFGPVLDAFGARASDDPERQAASQVVQGAVSNVLTERDGAWVPELVWPEDTLPFTTAATFDQWFRDVEGVNVGVDLDDRVQRTAAGTAMIVGPGSAPHTTAPLVDDTFGFGVGRQDRLGSKTFEVVATFDDADAAGARLRFASSDDLWVYVDDRLVIDSGGFDGHMTSYNGYQRAWVLDVDGLGLTPGVAHTLRAFIADRGHDGTFQWWAEAPGCTP